MRDALGDAQSLLVLGASSEIAQAITTRLVERRTRRVVLAARRPETLAAYADALRAAGAAVETVAFDADRTDEHEAIVGAVFDEGDIDVVVMAFAVMGDQTAFDAQPRLAVAAARTNYLGSLSVGLEVASRLRRQGHGTLVVLSSVAGERVRAANFVYGSTKAGLDGFAQGLGDLVAADGVHVLVVRPGFVHSAMTAGLKAAPFSTTPEKVADDIVAGLAKSSRIVWSPGVLRWVFSIMRHLPHPAWRIVSNR